VAVQLLGDISRFRESPIQSSAPNINHEGSQNGGFRSYADGILTLPGQGTRPDSCGDWFPSEFCDACGEVELSRSACHSRGCPQCWHKWTRDSARRIAIRLSSARQAQPDDFSRRSHHIVVSPPPQSIKSLNGFYRAQKRAYEIAREHGISGGTCIPHAYRATEEAKQRWQENSDEEGGGIWQWIRENGRDWEELVEWGPHFHIIGMGEDLEFRAREDDWLFKQIRSLEPHRLTDLKGYDDIIGCARYLLSHCTFDPDDSKQSIRWFGTLSPSGFAPESALSSGTYSAVVRTVDKAFAAYDEGQDETKPTGDMCRREDCAGQLLSIFDAGVRLTQEEWVAEIDQNRRARLVSSYRWAIGDLGPPPDEVLTGSREGLRDFLTMVGGKPSIGAKGD